MNINYSKLTKEKLISLCIEYQTQIEALIVRVKDIEENEEINKSLLLENIHLKEELENTRKERDKNYQTIECLYKNVETYKECLKCFHIRSDYND